MAEESIIESFVTNDQPNKLDSKGNLVEPDSIAPTEDFPKISKEEVPTDELENLFEKNTASFRCLAQLLISRSSVIGHPLYKFDPPVDPGIDEAFYSNIGVDLSLDTVGILTYKSYCKESEIVPISRIIKSLPTNTLDLRYYGLSLKQIKALTAALVFNRHVESLILEENVLESEAIFYISEMLRDNNCISYLSLKNCWIGPVAIEKLSEGIFTSQLVTELDLSHNNIKSSGLASLLRSIRNNMSIKKLNLSHNGLLGDVCIKFGRALAENDCLEQLDLSWNSLSILDGLQYLCAGLTEKDKLRVLNLAWNGISTKEALIPIIKYMKATTTLEHIDLSNNQMQGNLIKIVRAGLLGNSSLISVNMSSNIITPEEASSLAHVFTADRGELTEPLKLKYLDMENIYVNKSFLPYWRKLTREGKFVRIEGIFSNYKIIGPDMKKLLFDRIRFLCQKAKKKKARKEFGHFLHSVDKTMQEPLLPDTDMIKADFFTALKKFKVGKVYKDQNLLKEILKKYTDNKDKVNTTLMRKEYYNYYPNTTIPEPKKKKKGGKKGKGKKRKEVDVVVDKDAVKIADAQESPSSIILKKEKSVSLILTENKGDKRLSQGPTDIILKESVNEDIKSETASSRLSTKSKSILKKKESKQG